MLVYESRAFLSAQCQRKYAICLVDLLIVRGSASSCNQVVSFDRCSVCAFKVPYKALRAKCNLWRNWKDIQDSWDSLASILVFWARETLHNRLFQETAGPGAWNDPDMLIIGNQVYFCERLSTHFGASYCLARSISNDHEMPDCHASPCRLLLSPLFFMRRSCVDEKRKGAHAKEVKVNILPCL